MKLDIVDINRFIRVNNVQEVTNPNTFEQGYYPTEDGVLSYKIFGLSGSYDRRTLFGYIDLKKHFLHPLIYKNLKTLNRKIADLVSGNRYFSITSDGQLVEDSENGNTGLDWLYNNWEKIKWKKTNSYVHDANVTLLTTLKKNEIFVNSWLVIPASMRDVDMSKAKSGKVSQDKLNDFYNSLLLLCQSVNDDFDFMGYLTENKIQLKLVDIFEYLISYVGGGKVNALGVNRAGKNQLIQNDLLGKRLAQLKLY
jgi:DNA-directed RNA polymerase beta' subunit